MPAVVVMGAQPVLDACSCKHVYKFTWHNLVYSTSSLYY